MAKIVLAPELWMARAKLAEKELVEARAALAEAAAKYARLEKAFLENPTHTQSRCRMLEKEVERLRKTMSQEFHCAHNVCSICRESIASLRAERDDFHRRWMKALAERDEARSALAKRPVQTDAQWLVGDELRRLQAYERIVTAPSDEDLAALVDSMLSLGLRVNCTAACGGDDPDADDARTILCAVADLARAKETTP